MCTRPAQAVTSLRKPARSPTISRFPPAGPQCLRQPALPRVPTPSCSPQARHPSPIRPARFLPAGFPPASRLSPSRPALPQAGQPFPYSGPLSPRRLALLALPPPARFPRAGPLSTSRPAFPSRPASPPQRPALILPAGFHKLDWQ